MQLPTRVSYTRVERAGVSDGEVGDPERPGAGDGLAVERGDRHLVERDVVEIAALAPGDGELHTGGARSVMTRRTERVGDVERQRQRGEVAGADDGDLTEVMPSGSSSGIAIGRLVALTDAEANSDPPTMQYQSTPPFITFVSCYLFTQQYPPPFASGNGHVIISSLVHLLESDVAKAPLIFTSHSSYLRRLGSASLKEDKVKNLISTDFKISTIKLVGQWLVLEANTVEDQIDVTASEYGVQAQSFRHRLAYGQWRRWCQSKHGAGSRHGGR